MHKIDEIIDQNRLRTDHYASQDFVDYGTFSVESAMIEYAEWYAKKCLEIAAENAKVFGDHDCDVDPMSITEIDLPPHV